MSRFFQVHVCSNVSFVGLVNIFRSQIIQTPMRGGIIVRDQLIKVINISVTPSLSHHAI